MKIQTVRISDFRSIKSLSFECKPGINVIAGVNGAGKSTLLDAVETALSWLRARIRLKTASGDYPAFADIRKGKDVARIRIVSDTPENVSWEVVRVSPGYRGNDRPKSDFGALTALADRLVSGYYADPAQVGLLADWPSAIRDSTIRLRVRA